LIEAAEAGFATPELRSRPQLEFHEQYAIEHYLRLSGSRRPSMSDVPMPIPASEAASFYEFMGLAQHYERERWLDIVAMLDQVMVDHGKRLSDRRQRERDRKK
jgi:hypothetical protein